MLEPELSRIYDDLSPQGRRHGALGRPFASPWITDSRPSWASLGYTSMPFPMISGVVK
jgi:hypothetical protein